MFPNSSRKGQFMQCLFNVSFSHDNPTSQRCVFFLNYDQVHKTFQVGVTQLKPFILKCVSLQLNQVKFSMCFLVI